MGIESESQFFQNFLRGNSYMTRTGAEHPNMINHKLPRDFSLLLAGGTVKVKYAQLSSDIVRGILPIPENQNFHEDDD